MLSMVEIAWIDLKRIGTLVKWPLGWGSHMMWLVLLILVLDLPTFVGQHEILAHKYTHPSSNIITLRGHAIRKLLNFCVELATN